MTTMARRGLNNLRIRVFLAGAIWLSAIIALPVSGADPCDAAQMPRYRVFSLRKVTPEQGRQYLADANIGTVSQIPGTATLLVTGSGEDLVKAAALLKLVDTNQPFTVRTLPRSDFTSVKDIVSQIEDISVGTFFDPPTGPVQKAIIDTHGGNIIVIAPSTAIDRLTSIIKPPNKTALRAKPDARTELYESALSPDASESNSLALIPPLPSEVGMAEAATKKRPTGDEIFNDLLGALEQAERKIATAPAEPNKAAAIKPQPEPAEPAPEEIKPEAEPPGKEQPEEKPVEEPTEPARQPYLPEVTPDVNGGLTLNLPEKLPLIQLLDFVGKYYNLNYVYDATLLQPITVDLKFQGPITVRELYPLLESVLKFRQYAMSRRGNLVIIAPIANAMDIDPALIDDQMGKVRFGDVVVTRIYQLSYIDPTSAMNLINAMRLGATSMPVSGTSTLIVTGYASNMDRADRAIEMIDKPGRPKVFKFRQLKYTMAKVLAPKVKSLVEQMGDIAITIGATTTAQPGGRPVSSRVRPVPGQPPAAVPPQPGAPATPEAAGGKPSVYLDADERTNRVLMIGHEAELTVVDGLIDALDVEQQDLRALRVYEIQNVDAEEVRTKLVELGIVTGGTGRAGEGRITGGRTVYSRPEAGQPGGQPPAPTPTPAAAAGGTSAEPLAEEPQVILLEATNALLVNATTEQHLRIATIISYVDSETIQQAIPYVIYKLENQKPEDLAETLTKLIQETIKDEKGKVERIVQRQEDNIIIVPDEGTFSLIVYASKKNQEWISNLIKTLDKRRPQVLIDVTLVEVTRLDQFDLDLQLATKLPKMVPGGEMDFLGKTSGGLPSEVFPNKDHIGEATIDSGALAGFYSDRHIQALLTAVQAKNYGRVLAKPKILVNDGQEGTIKTTTTTNVEIQTLVPGTANQDPFSTTTFQAYDAGIELKITPNISEGDLLLLEVAMTRSDFVEGSGTSGEKPPDKVASDITTTVTVPNDKTIILGGMVKLRQNKGGSKTPVLGDIPLIGGLFRGTHNKADDSKLYIFVKANILRPEDTLGGVPEVVKISEKSRQAFEKLEKEYQGYGDWPGIKPKPIDPLRVLDEE